jgi:hypothetical protein
MTTVKMFLVTAICGLVLFGAVAAQALGLGDGRGPNCFESPDVRPRPCPPPTEDPEDPEALEDWRGQLFRAYRPR